jgi:hypothetical protein
MHILALSEKFSQFFVKEGKFNLCTFTELTLPPKGWKLIKFTKRAVMGGITMRKYGT